mmetsp:Transcript_7177/g.15528  ORF Transcript_7177/g.15528 Transcript_7177/m.15528 type:complete len:207 (-) Transcript_7177:70-690(-)
MSIICITHLHHNAELLQLIQHDLRRDIRIPRTIISVHSHSTRTSIANQFVRIHPIQTILSCARRTAILPNARSDERIRLADRVQLVMVKTIGYCESISLGLDTMLEYDVGIRIFIRRDIGIVQILASVTVGAESSCHPNGTGQQKPIFLHQILDTRLMPFCLAMSVMAILAKTTIAMCYQIRAHFCLVLPVGTSRDIIVDARAAKR